jgi:hypothetical protein
MADEDLPFRGLRASTPIVADPAYKFIGKRHPIANKDKPKRKPGRGRRGGGEAPRDASPPRAAARAIPVIARPIPPRYYPVPAIPAIAPVVAPVVAPAANDILEDPGNYLPEGAPLPEHLMY